MNRGDQLRTFAFEAAVGAALYLALAWRASAVETIAAAATGILSAGGLQLIRRHTDRRLKPRWAWYALCLERVWLRSLKDCAILLIPLWRLAARRAPILGEMLDVPFDPGGEDPRSAARRALVLAGVTVAPNTLAIRVDGAKQILQVHRLVPTSTLPGSGDWEWPI